MHMINFICAIFFAATTFAGDAPLRSIAEVTEATRLRREWMPFELEVKAVSPVLDRGGGAFLAEDDSGRGIIHAVPKCDVSQIRPGAVLKVAGKTSLCELKNPESAVLPFATDISAIRTESAAPPPEAKIQDIVAGRHILEYVTVSGEVRDAFNDDIDPNFSFLVLAQDGASMYIPLRKREDAPSRLSNFIGSEVSITGIVHGNDGTGARRYADVTMFCGGFDSVCIIKQARGMDGIPLLDEAKTLNPAKISTMERRRASGRVVAVWGDGRFFMRTTAGDLMRIELADGNPPRCGDLVEAAGFPETDLFNINLESAVWHPAPDSAQPPDDKPPLAVSASEIMPVRNGVRTVNSAFFGRAVTICGTVIRIPSNNADKKRMMLETANLVMPVDCFACPEAFKGIDAGSRVKVSGVVVFDADNWRANDIFPKINDLLIAVRSPSDVVILSHPSWWTPLRLLVVIGVLVVVIAAIMLWNLSLRVLAERRGRALYRARMNKAASELRLDERTRLATELHDYIVQDMTAISYQVTAAKHAHKAGEKECATHLETAERMLGSCRTELRRCLWDLRNEALDEHDVSKAVETSIKPIAGNAATNIRIDVPRNILDDSTMHAMLSIVRELAHNAVTHGRASTISITGKVQDEFLVLTVGDDGVGFDFSTAPSAAEGHFGLAGAQERSLRHGGEFTVKSTPGRGTVITVSLKLPPAKQ